MTDNQKVNAIIDHAINRENEAIKFYQELQGVAALSEKKKFLQNLAKTEEGHKNTLEKIRRKEIGEMTIPEVQTLRISEYLIEVPLNEKMSYQDILIAAMKREETSNKLYNELANRCADPGIKKLFRKLASEEAKHKLKFEEMYDEEILNED